MKESPNQQQGRKFCSTFTRTMLLLVDSDNRLQELKEQLKSANEEVMKLRSTVAIKEEASGLLQHQLKEVEQKYKSQISIKDALIQKLQSELDSQSNSIAYLTMKLHQSKQKYRKAMEQLKTFYNSGYTIHGSDSFIEDDIKKLDRNPVRAKTPHVTSDSMTGNYRGSKSEPNSHSKTVSRELPQIPMSPCPPSTPRNASTPSSGKVRRMLLRRSSSHTAPSSSSTTPSSCGESASSSSSLSHSPYNPLHLHYNITDVLEPGTLNMDALKLGLSHPVLPPIQDDSQSPTESYYTSEDNSPQKLVRTQQLPSESFVGIQKIKNLSNARKTATSNRVTTAESNSRVLVKEDTSRKAH